MIAAARTGLGLGNQPDADFGEHDVEALTALVFSIDRAQHGAAPSNEPLDIWAFRAINAAVSDLACGGVTSCYAQIDLQVPAGVTTEEVVLIGQGVRAALDWLDVKLLNGNNTTSGPLGITTAVHGVRPVHPRPPGRSGARPGDHVLCSRLPGRFNSALDLVSINENTNWLASALLGGVAELDLGRILVERELVSTLIDANDCLLLTLRDLARASGVAIELDRGQIEAEAQTLDWSPRLETILKPPSGDLALVATVRPDRLEATQEAFLQLGRRPSVVGICAEGSPCVRIDGMTPDQLDLISAIWLTDAAGTYPANTVRAEMRRGRAW